MVTQFHSGPKEGEIHYEGPSTIDNEIVDISAQEQEATSQVSATSSSNIVKRKNTFRKRIGSCGVHNNYQHRFIGGSFELSKPADVVGKAGLTTAIGASLPNPVSYAAGFFAAVILGLGAASRNYTFGERDFDTAGNDLMVSVVAPQYNAPVSSTVPSGQPKGGHIKH